MATRLEQQRGRALTAPTEKLWDNPWDPSWLQSPWVYWSRRPEQGSARAAQVRSPALRGAGLEMQEPALGCGDRPGAALGTSSASPQPGPEPQPSTGDVQEASLYRGKGEIKSKAGIPCQQKPSSPHCSETLGIKGPSPAPFFCLPKVRACPRLTVCRH